MQKVLQAKNKIKQYFKKIFKEENVEKGKELVEKELKRQKISHSEAMKNEIVEVVLKRFNYFNVDDLYASIGSGALSPSLVVAKIKDEIYKDEIKVQPQPLVETKKEFKQERRKDTSKPGVEVKGEGFAC